VIFQDLPPWRAITKNIPDNGEEYGSNNGEWGYSGTYKTVTVLLGGPVMKTELLSPQNSALILIDFQPQMTFGVATMVHGVPASRAGSAGH
jgi:hypothetical protein